MDAHTPATPTVHELEERLNNNQRQLIRMTLDVAKAVMTSDEFTEVIMFLYACLQKQEHQDGPATTDDSFAE